MHRILSALSFTLLLCAPLALAQPNEKLPYQYFRTGSPTNVAVKTSAGYALMGGGKDLDQAFQWLCGHGAGGDFLVLRASGDDAYNPYIQKLCRLNSVATVVIPSRAAAQHPFVAAAIRHAAIIFISGGDQAKYVNNWAGTPVADALNDHIAQGRAIGGTSAGLAVLGEYTYSARGDAPDDKDLSSQMALNDPFLPRVTVDPSFLSIPLLKNTITDTHFAKRNRMGRSLTFLARILNRNQQLKPQDLHEIAVDERNAFLLAPSGEGKVVGTGKGAYFIRPTRPPEVISAGKPLSLHAIDVYKVPPGHTFNIKTWQGEGGTAYQLNVQAGKLSSTSKSVY